MSIRKHRSGVGDLLWVHCDICDEDQNGDALGPAHGFTRLQDLMQSEGWHSQKGVDGKWHHFCPECWKNIRGEV